MNFSASRIIHRAFTRHLSKALEFQNHHVQNRTVGAYHPACTEVTNAQRSPILFDGRGVGRSDSTSVWGIDSLKLHSVSCNMNTSVWRSRISAFHSSSVNRHGEYEWQDPKTEEEIVQVHFVDKEGKAVTIRGKIGDNLLYLAKRFEVEMEGACEASLACTTCHIYVDDDYLELLPEATETEEDLLDQAPFLRNNSRLGCQIILNKELDGLKLRMPAATKNFYVDGHKPTPH